MPGGAHLRTLGIHADRGSAWTALPLDPFRSLEHLAGDHDLLHLRGALVDGEDADVAVEPLDLVLTGVAVAAVEHTKNRVQFGKPLCKHQAIAFMLADMETKLNAARGLVYNAAWLMDNKQPADKAASMAKYYAAEAAIDIINKSLQLHGGYGYSREYEIERLYRDVRVCSIYEGSSQVQQIVISGQMLK